MSRAARLSIAALTALLGGLALASMASAAFHFTLIREVSGGASGSNESYVEIQMYAGGQNFFGGHQVNIYDEMGALAGSCPLMMVANGENQRTILVGDDAVTNSDVDCPGLELETGGLGDAAAVCFDAGHSNAGDCVSWGGGAFMGALMLPDDASPWPFALPSATALVRKICGGSDATRLDPGDDTNSTATDFEDLARDPTPNSVAPSNDCGGPGDGGDRGGTTVKCGGLTATRVGTAGANVLVGTAGKDVIAGLGGKDKIRGLAGNDVLCGGAGRDKLIGGGGRDRLLGQAGKDTCVGGPKKDTARTCETKRTI